MSRVYDVAVVGAGPYGLSTAAHLLGAGLRVAVFGRPLEMWREHMPQGMLLRSHWWATNLSDPGREHGMARFLVESGHDRAYPMPIDTFVEYGLWFQRRAVPQVDETYVASLERQDDHFLLTLEDGRAVETRAVVMAIGPRYYANRPAPYSELPPAVVSHSSEHADFRQFGGRDVVVIGGGQSAIESAALLREAGAVVQVVARRPIVWLPPDRMHLRSPLERILAPNASIAPGWDNWVLDHLPYLFHRVPQARKDAYNAQYHSGATDWLRSRVIGKVTLRDNRTVSALRVGDGKVTVTLSDGARLRTDHILLATGYSVDIDKLAMLHPSLRAAIQTGRGSPVLNHWFESSVPGLYFVGLTSLRAFGPLYRFVAGCGAAARRVARAIARRGAGNSRMAPRRAAVAGAAGAAG